MRSKAYVLNFENELVWVSPIINNTCINCNQPTCSKRGSPFLAANPNKLEIKCGDIVQLGTSTKAQFFQGIIALLLPIIAAAGGYLLAEPIAQLFEKTVTESMRAAGVLLCLGISTAIITIITRSKLNLSKPLIVSILQKNITN
ncbi:MAG: SoxR reducing system RseC family protein [Spirochaetaceae bacterium]|nr:SoxR reducing system RseC family protein [Spirochaetaceae bacterium]